MKKSANSYLKSNENQNSPSITYIYFNQNKNLSFLSKIVRIKNIRNETNNKEGTYTIYQGNQEHI